MKILLIALVLLAGRVYGQHTDCLSRSVTINGEVSATVRIDEATLGNLKWVKLADLTITNHKGEIKRTLTNLEGVLLKDVLQQATIKTEAPKLLSEFYLVFTACDGYKVVYSWNELFNNPLGNSIYLIKEKNGETISSVSTSDIMTGRRYVQGLSFITIKRCD